MSSILKITDKTEPRLVSIGCIERGEVAVWDGMVCLKLGPGSTTGPVRCLDFNTYETFNVPYTQVVSPVDAELVLR